MKIEYIIAVCYMSVSTVWMAHAIRQQFATSEKKSLAWDFMVAVINLVFCPVCMWVAWLRWGSLSAPSNSERPEKIQTLSVAPNESLIVTFDHMPRDTEREMVIASLRAVIPKETKCVVLFGDIRLTKIRSEGEGE